MKNWFILNICPLSFILTKCLTSEPSYTGYEIALDRVTNAPMFTLLATEIQKLMATLATGTLQVLYILPLYTMQLKKALRQINHTFGVTVERFKFKMRGDVLSY